MAYILHLWPPVKINSSERGVSTRNCFYHPPNNKLLQLAYKTTKQM